MFGPLKKDLGGHRFDSDTTLKMFVRNVLESRPSFDNETKKLPIRWEKYVMISDKA